MPIVTIAYWELVHEWGNSDNYGNWTEEMMLDELLELDKVREEIRPKKTLLEFINEMQRVDGNVIKVKSRAVDFKSICNIIDVWKHVTTNCKYFGRRWIAQDESQLECFKRKHPYCDGHGTHCSDYKPMLEAKSIEELLKGEKVVFT